LYRWAFWPVATDRTVLRCRAPSNSSLSGAL
jgi:hypothetical protein